MHVQHRLTAAVPLAHIGRMTPLRPGPVSAPTALILAIRQLGDRAILGVLVKSLALTLITVVALGYVLWVATFRALERWPAIAGAELTGLFLGIAMFVIGWLLFRIVAIAVIGVFSDQVVDAVERRHYPAAASRAAPVPFTGGLRMGLQSAGRTIGYNVVALPLYVASLATGVGLPLLLWAVNALVLAKDLEAMVRARHPDLPPQSRAARWATGGVASALFFVPVANLLAPIVAAAFAVHRMHAAESVRPA